MTPWELEQLKNEITDYEQWCAAWSRHAARHGGISYGGMFAIRTAAVDERVRAVFAISTWYTPAGRFAAMDDLTRPGQYQHHGPDPAANMAAMTLSGMAARARAPLLQLYGGNDPGSPPAGGERIAANTAARSPR